MTNQRARNCREVAVLLGLVGQRKPSKPYVKRTMENVRAEIRSFYQQHGRRPRTAEVASVYVWCRNHGTSLKDICDEMGLPHISQYTIELCRHRVSEFYETHGRRPKRGEVHLERGVHAVISLKELCDDAGLPRGHRMGRTRESCRKKLLGFYQEHGRSPVPRDVWRIYQWLYERGISWRDFCRDAGLPPVKPGPVPKR